MADAKAVGASFRAPPAKQREIARESVRFPSDHTPEEPSQRVILPKAGREQTAARPFSFSA